MHIRFEYNEEAGVNKDKVNVKETQEEEISDEGKWENDEDKEDGESVFTVTDQAT